MPELFRFSCPVRPSRCWQAGDALTWRGSAGVLVLAGAGADHGRGAAGPADLCCRRRRPAQRDGFCLSPSRWPPAGAAPYPRWWQRRRRSHRRASPAVAGGRAAWRGALPGPRAGRAGAGAGAGDACSWRWWWRRRRRSGGRDAGPRPRRGSPGGERGAVERVLPSHHAGGVGPAGCARGAGAVCRAQGRHRHLQGAVSVPLSSGRARDKGMKLSRLPACLLLFLFAAALGAGQHAERRAASAGAGAARRRVRRRARRAPHAARLAGPARAGTAAAAAPRARSQHRRRRHVGAAAGGAGVRPAERLVPGAERGRRAPPRRRRRRRVRSLAAHGGESGRAG